jgi:hypothetical protein
VKRIFLALTACLGAAWIVAGAQAQQYPQPSPPGSQPAPPPQPPPPPPPPDLANCDKQTAKLSVVRADYSSAQRTISIFAPISTLASGLAEIDLYGARRITEFAAPIDSARGRILATRGVDAAQARASSVILTLRYAGDEDTRPQSLRLRAGQRRARLSSRRPTISTSGQLDAAGAITRLAKGLVRLQLEWVNRSDGAIIVVERQAIIRNGRWGIRYQLPPGVISQINNRCTTVHSYVLFTGYQALNMRGEMRAFQVMPAPPAE